MMVSWWIVAFLRCVMQNYKQNIVNKDQYGFDRHCFWISSFSFMMIT